MSNARDKANIPSLNFSSTGIDDNATSTAITIDSGERVGIGNTTMSNFNASARQLVVGSGSGDNGITIFAGTTNNSSLFLADGTTGTNGYRGSINYLHNGDALTLHANATETMRLTNGNVGIGTSSPINISSTNLTVSGSTSSSLFFEDTGYEASGNGLFSLTYDDGNLKFETASRSGSGRTGNAERMRIDSSGNVGIGTSSPDAKLSVNGIASFGDGAESTPSITNFGDLDTGMYFPKANTIAFSTNGDETLRISENGVLTVNRGKLTNGGLLLVSKNPISVSTSATNISATSSYGSLAFVWGVSSGNIFHDLVSWSVSQVDVLASQNISASPAGRTYSASSGVLRVAMASGTYSVYESDIRTQTS